MRSGRRFRASEKREMLKLVGVTQARTGWTLRGMGQGELVLVVEDDEMVRQLTIDMLEHGGYRTIPAEDGQAALKALEGNEDVDVIFTDVVLPGGMSGPTLAREVRRKRPDVPVLFTSGYPREELGHHGEIDDEILLVEKPFSLETLMSHVAKVLGGHEARAGPSHPTQGGPR